MGNANKLSLEEQKEYLKRYANEQGYTNLEFYVDIGYSASNYNRPSFSKLKVDIEAGHVEAVITKSIDRIGRSIFERAHLIEWARNNGVKLHMENTPFEEINFDELGYYKRRSVERN